jgi:hypothetical protein
MNSLPNFILAALLAGVLLWLTLVGKAEAPRVDYYRPAPAKPASYVVPEREREFVRKVRERMERIKART